MSALLAGRNLPPAPISVDYSAGLPNDLGQLGNDVWGDCTCAAYYHARQIWKWGAQKELEAESVNDALRLYSEACGFTPSDPTTDQGGVEQDVLTYLMKIGAPLAAGERDKILGFVEVDTRNLDDVKRTIADCGVAYIGINLPQSVVDGDEPPAVWGFDPKNAASVGGHAIILVGYDLDSFIAISWGKRYRLTRDFFTNFTEEAYAIADESWIASGGRTPAGLTIDELRGQMAALRMAA